MIAALTAAAVSLVAAAAIGGRNAQTTNTAAPVTDTSEGGVTDEPGAVASAAPGVKGGPSAKPGATAGAGGGGGGASSTPTPNAGGGTKSEPERQSSVGATREGVHEDYFEFGIHGPLTLDGVPLNLAEDPVTGIKGYITYINRAGGINGLKVRMFLIDDRYTTQGGQQAADKLTKEIKPFIISGTLGIDQIAKVAKAAATAKIPYFGGGGPEPEFKDVGMYQNISNYDQYAEMVVDFICKYGAKYVGGTSAKDVRLGTTTLNSENILPVEKRFVTKLEQRKCVSARVGAPGGPIDPDARGTIQKPTEQKTYSDQMIKLRTSYNNLGANLIVPLQDPVSTSRQVAEWSASGYRPKWTIANFAHDSNTVLELMHGEWTGMRVMSGACYYHPEGGGDPYNPAKCAKMGEAHRQWNTLGNVTYDENAGGGVGGHSSYNYNEDGWHTDGSGGASGYQAIYFWFGAMKAIGADPTREKFIEALNQYDNYSNLLTGPITFKGSPNRMIGSTKFVLLEAQSNLKYRQVKEITPGLVDHF
jgi:ABC-type branched-subunit amino acid transport system substrate-binding protein